MSNMRTIAITIDDETLDRVDRAGGRNRSSLIRDAVREYLDRCDRALEEQHESRIVRKHRSRLAREGRALVRAQARP
jgi:metal-responsive CopG/Arc/MetJ family transcriptional regulator